MHARPGLSRLLALLLLLGAAAIVFASCGPHPDLQEPCPESVGCSFCGSNDECVTRQSCCSYAVYCGHQRDAEFFPRCEGGCFPHDAPSAALIPPCICVENRCRFQQQ
jgi:hypothetical protein